MLLGINNTKISSQAAVMIGLLQFGMSDLDTVRVENQYSRLLLIIAKSTLSTSVLSMTTSFFQDPRTRM
jgi:hypothetical protein